MFSFLTNLFHSRTKERTLVDDRANIERQQKNYLVGSETLNAAELLSQFPPRIEHEKKQLLFDIALARGLNGELTVCRYHEIPLPTAYQPYVPKTEVAAKKGYFRYATDNSAEHWFLNFAHHELFHGYGHFMFAQDEVQVAEHPALASLREWMLHRTDGLRPFTVENGAPTPVLVRSVQRMLNIDTRLIYGARFARSDAQTIRDSARPIVPPTHSNIVAIEAPISGGNKRYTRSEIQKALRTAFSGFRAVVLEAMNDSSTPLPVVIHTGNWGCGAYGGNRQLMLSLQLMAARLAGVSKIIFYCGTESVEDVATFESALAKKFKLQPNAPLESVVNRFADAGFPWGTPDGN